MRMEVIPREYKRNKINFFSLSIGDDQEKNFFGRDANTQTECTEIRDLQQMTEIMNQLVKDSRYLKRELLLSRQSMEAEYSSRLQHKCEELYKRCNDKVAELESVHEEKVAIIRRSFKQQLSDALMSLSSQNAIDRMNQPKPREDKKKNAGKDKLLELKLLNEELEKKLEDLRSDNELLQQENEELRRLMEESANEPKISQEDMDKLEDQLAKERDKIRELEDEIKRSAGNTEALKATIDQQNQKIDKLLVEKDKLEEEIDNLKKQIEEEKERMRVTVENLQKEFEKQKAEEVERATKEAIEKAKKEFEEERKKEMEELDRLKREKDELARNFKQQLDARDKQHSAALAKLKRAEKMMKTQLDRANKELEYCEKSWAKRLQILQDSNQAIREEVQTRTSMKKHVLKLKHAEVMYRTDDPTYYLPAPAPLPDIAPYGAASSTSRGLTTKDRGRVTFQDDAESMTLSYTSDKVGLNQSLDDEFNGVGESDPNTMLDKSALEILQQYNYLPQ